MLCGCQTDTHSEVLVEKLDGPTGRITGVVVFSGRHTPPPTVIANTKDAQACGPTIKKTDVVVSDENHGLANVVVWLADLQLPENYRPPRQDLRLAALRCQLTPRITAMTVGSTIKLHNADSIGHDVHLSGAQDGKIDLPTTNAEFTTVASAKGLMRVHCSDHDWMEAFVHIGPHPFHAVTNAEGNFSIESVPVGTHKLNAWHEKFQRQELEVTVRPDTITRLELFHPSATPLPYSP
jgi:hypothetical protein